MIRTVLSAFLVSVAFLFSPVIIYGAAPSISQSIYSARRDSLLKKIPRGVVVMAAAPQVMRNGDMEYEYRQNSDFYYLTGFQNQGALLVLRPNAEQQYVLFVRPHNIHAEIYTGSRPGVAGAMTTFGADTAFTTDQIETVLPQLIGHSKTLYVSFGENQEMQDEFNSILEEHYIRPDTLINVTKMLHQMRLVKSDYEIGQIQKAIDITGDAQREMMRLAAPKKYEYEIAAAVEYVFSDEGATAPSFPSIVASGKNATTLHYFDNNAQFHDGDLLLVDIGAEYQMYAADITRTVPVNGKFSPEQKALYQAVLNVQTRAIDAVQPGMTIDELNKLAQRESTKELLRLGILQGDLDSVVAAKAVHRFLPHGISHHLGIDAHDPGGYSRRQATLPLQPGMVITIEPGLYIRAGIDNVDPKWDNLGIRIEDDILVTKSGHKILSEGIPKSIKAIEKEMKQKPHFIKR